MAWSPFFWAGKSGLAGFSDTDSETYCTFQIENLTTELSFAFTFHPLRGPGRLWLTGRETIKEKNDYRTISLYCAATLRVTFGSRSSLRPFHIFRLNAWSSLSTYQPSSYPSDISKVLSSQCSSLFVKWNMLGKSYLICYQVTLMCYVICSISLHTISTTTMPSLQRMKYSTRQAFEIQ